MNTANLRHSIIVAFLLGVSLFGCATERAQDPVDRGWVVYAANGDGMIYVLDADSLQVLDSMDIRRSTYTYVSRILVHPDSRSLFVQAVEYPPIEPKLYRVDVQSHEVLSEYADFVSSLMLADEGRMLLVNRPDRESQKSRCLVLDPLTLNIVDSFPLGLRFHRASAESRMVPIGIDSESKLHLMDLRTRAMSGEYEIPRLDPESDYSDMPYDALLHPDIRTVLLTREFAFEVGDISTGENLLRVGRMREHGEIAITADGRTAVVAYPSTWITGLSDLIEFYNLADGSRSGFIVSGIENRFASGRIIMLPDGQRALTCPDPGSSSVGGISVIDLGSMSIAAHVSSPSLSYVLAIALGRRL